jgi:protease-4
MESKPDPQPTQPASPAPGVRESARPSVPRGDEYASRPAPPPPAPPPYRPPSLLRRVLGWGLLLVIGYVVATLFGLAFQLAEYYDTTGGVEEKYHSGATLAGDKVAIIEIEGVIVEGDGYVRHQIEMVRQDPDVKAVVVRVNSPGGTVTGSDYILHHLVKLRDERKLPMVVSMGSLAASGGYYVSMAVGGQKDAIFAEPTTTTGSIGVIIPHYDLTGLMSEWSIKDDSVASGPYKQMLSMTRQMSPEERALAQAYVDDSFARFKEIIKQGRPLFQKEPETLDQLATGEIFTAQKAKEHGLVDQIGFIEDAIDRATELAQLNSEDVRVVRYLPEETLFGELPIPISQSRAPLDQRALLELSVPRAYYLFTSLPALAASAR